jgi:chemotaxis protein methyltransferase CheR
VISGPPPATPLPCAEISTQNYQFLQEHIYRESGIVLDHGKHYLFEARLGPIVVRRRMRNLNDLCTLLRASEESVLRQEVVEAMTTNETLFFRDIDTWNGLQTTVIPELVERHSNNRILRFWSAAASSGQEAYSLAMLLLEMGLGDWHIEILASDLSAQILDRASAGRYSQLEVNRGLPAKYLIKYFKHQAAEWQLKDEVRRMVKFTQMDLRKVTNALPPFDLVMCRNVMIYFDIATKKRILQGLKDALFHRGYLVLGCAETTLNLDDTFGRRNVGRTTFYVAP